jgi:hypothetical protein
MTQDEALKLALEALKSCSGVPHWPALQPVITSLRQAIAGLESQEPVAWMKPDVLCDRACMYLCTKGFTQFPECATIHPPQRTWVGLTDEEIEDIVEDCDGVGWDVAQAIRAKLKEKNT